MPPTRRGMRGFAGALAAAGVLMVLSTTVTTGHKVPAGPLQLVGYGSSLRETLGAPGMSSTVPGAPRVTASGSFSISGTMKGLYPGAIRPLVLTVGNPMPVAITVTEIATSVGGAPPTCPATNLMVTRFSGQLHVGARSTSRLAVEVVMAHSAPQGCQGAMFTLEYWGIASG